MRLCSRSLSLLVFSIPLTWVRDMAIHGLPRGFEKLFKRESCVDGLEMYPVQLVL